MEGESAYQIKIGWLDLKDPSSFGFEVEKFL